MPRIREYQAEVPAAGIPQSRRADANDFGGTGAGLLTLGQALATASERVHQEDVRREISATDAEWSQRMADWTVEFQRRAQEAPAGDASYADTFIETMENDASKLREGLQTRQADDLLSQRIGRAKAHFRQEAGQWAIRTAGQKALQDYQGDLNARRNALLADPGQFLMALEDTEAALQSPDSPYARIPAADRERLARVTRGELALSAVQGVMNRNPGEALAQLTDGQWNEYLDADKAAALRGEAERRIEGLEIDAARAEARAERALRREREGVANDFLARLSDGTLTAEQVLKSNLSAFGEGSKSTFINLLKKNDNPDRDSRTYGPAFVDLFRRVNAPDGSPEKITDDASLYAPLERGDLTYSGIQALRAELQGRRSLDGAVEGELKKRMFDTAQASLTATDPILRIRDPKGDERLQAFMAWFLPEYQRQRSGGKSALQLLDPQSPDYLGKGLAQFRRSRADFMRDVFQDNPGNPALPAVPQDQPPAQGATYKNRDEVLNAYRAGKVSRDDARKILQDNGWAR